MAKKIFYTSLAIMILFLCCGICFGTENENSVNLGNEITESIDKAGSSFENVVSGNVINDARNTIDDIGDFDMENTSEYNTVRTETEGVSGENNGINSMSTTTWMWIILVVAAIVIMAAIWYYATQNN